MPTANQQLLKGHQQVKLGCTFLKLQILCTYLSAKGVHT